MKAIVAYIGFATTLFFQSDVLEKAAAAYQSQNYSQSMAHYKEALQEFPLQSDLIRLNMAQVLYAQQLTEEALQTYRSVVQRLPRSTESLAYNNIAVLEASTDNTEESLQHLRQALDADESNETARLNYEWLYKNRPPEPPLPPPPPQHTYKQSAPVVQENKGIRRHSTPLDHAHALQLLEEYRKTEKQFIQQFQKRTVQ